MVIGELRWQPFHVRLNNFLERLKFHEKVLQDEQTILHLKSAPSSIEFQVEEEKRAQEFRVQSSTYFSLVKNLAAKTTAAELGELHRNFPPMPPY
jgi:hypothetical protein